MNGAPNNSGLWDRIVQAFTESHGFSDVTQISDLLGLSYQSVYKWKSGMLPSIDTLLKVADLTNSSTHWLLTGRGPKFAQDDMYLGLPTHLRQQIKKVADASETTFEDALEELVSRQLAAMEGDYDLGETRKIPVYRMATDEELFGNLDSLIEQVPQERKHETLTRMIGELVVKAAAAGQK